jgi:hypothetical protein
MRLHARFLPHKPWHSYNGVAGLRQIGGVGGHIHRLSPEKFREARMKKGGTPKLPP